MNTNTDLLPVASEASQQLAQEVIVGGQGASAEQWKAWNARFEALPPAERADAWCSVTTGVFDQINLCKLVHHHWVHSMMELFGIIEPPGGFPPPYLGLKEGIKNDSKAKRKARKH